MAPKKDGCVKPAKGPISAPETAASSSEPVQTSGKEPRMIAQVGKPAPDFEVNAFVDGGFENIKLSDYKGQWIVLCFYPGDFTFV
jgi:peroxiredoxin (alkyl hydroperoxide reductase subunit C)